MSSATGSISPGNGMTPTATLMTLAQAHALLPDSVLVGDGATPILRVHSDSRSLQPGDLFVALRGEHFDAHDFLPQAAAAGAGAALAERGLGADARAEASTTAVPGLPNLPGLLVPDVLLALQQLATAWRAKLDLPLIAVAGSNGKTTVTQMIAAILRAWLGDAALATVGNFNNHIGVPLTLLRLRQDPFCHHRAAVLELGMNHPGEIALLAKIAQPTVALVNNAQREHQEFMLSVRAVAEENGAVISALPASGTAVYPSDDEYAPVWQALAGPRAQLIFAGQAPADVFGDAQWLNSADLDAVPGPESAKDGGHWLLNLHTPAGALACKLYAAGAHNLRNALAAATAALAAGAPLAAIADGLQAFRPVAGRSQTSRLLLDGRPLTLVNDSYNANPDSVRAAISLLLTLPGPRGLILGDMGEVGDQGPAFHAEVGAFARAAGIDLFWTAGVQCADAARAYGAGARHFEQTTDLIAVLPGLPACGALLVKGSRFMRMESVVAALQQRSAAQKTGAPHAA